ncbi:MAG: hypothetical protein RLZZ628_499 [Bacteroidota bacterium]|jgi:hypothetical protein
MSARSSGFKPRRPYIYFFNNPFVYTNKRSYKDNSFLPFQLKNVDFNNTKKKQSIKNYPSHKTIYLILRIKKKNVKILQKKHFCGTNLNPFLVDINVTNLKNHLKTNFKKPK